MDELLEMFNSFIGEALDYERAMDAEFVELEKKLSECVSLAKERGTPVQNKKRPKRQASLSEKEEEASGKSAGEEEEQSEARTSTNDRSTTGGTGKSSSARMLDVSGGKGAGEKQAPQPMDTTTSQANESSVRPSRTARLKAQEKLKEPAIGSKLRNDGGTAVTIKLERNSSVANSTLVRGGKEALVAMEKTTLERTYVEMETENDANRANRIISPAAAAAEKRTNDEGFSSANEASQKEPAKQAGKSERDMSLLVVPPVIPKVEIVSDEEMPPPSIMPPPKLPAPKVRTKKKPPVGEKGAKDTSDTASSSAVSSADSTMNSTASSVSSSASNSSSTTAKNRVGRPTRTKTKQTGKQVEEPVAAEAPSNPTTPPAVLMDVGVLIEPMRIKAEKLSIVQQPPAPADRTSDKSTYEDAQEQQEPMEVETTTTTTAQLQSQMRPLKIALQKIPSHELPQQAHVGPSDMNGTYTTGTAAGQPIPSDGTFTMPPSIHDGTFTVNSPMENARGALICNETFDIPGAGGTPPMAGSERHPDETYVIEKSGGGSSGGTGQQQQQHVPLANASIMTEDDSVVENSPAQPAPEQLKSKTTTPRTRIAAAAAAPPPVPGPKPQRGAAALKKSASAVADAKKNKELFNPCVMSPIKSRIEAFEKCATATGGSAASKIGTPQAQIGRLMKTVSTPTLGTTEPHGITRSAHAKPYTSSSSSSVYTPNCAAQPPMPKASSASKIGQMQSRALHHGTTSGGSAQSHSRDSSWDRAGGGGGSGGTLSAASSTSSLLDEKKKKREEKQRLAAAQREAMEREKREHAERLVREKEEKYRKLVQEKQEKLRLDAQKKARKLEEFEKRRQAEEQKTLADQKRDELAKQLADQERINRELLDTLKQNQTKDAHETKLHKQLYQQRLRQQQQQLEKQHHQQQLAAKKKLAGGAAGSSAASKKLFTFEMIDTDDSTDEEVSEDTSAPRKKQRPPLPEWCQNTADFRKQLQLQAQLQSSVIDRLFSVQPMTPDLRLLFPSIDAQKLKRNSSAIWRTPPRHSQLP